jgi:RecA-family ATPase
MKPETTKELLSWTPPKVQEVISSGLLLPGSRMILFGRWGSWKSMLSMHMGFCTALGRPWLGFNTTVSSTLILQVEIPRAQLQKRVAKYVAGNQVLTLPDNLWFLTEPFIKLDKGIGISKLDAVLSIYRPRVLIIDPIYKVLSSDITRGYDVQSFLDNLDELIAKHSLSIVLVGHTRKPIPTENGSDLGHELIGSSYFQDWCDTLVNVYAEGDVLTLTIPKCRHAEEELQPFQVIVDRNNIRFVNIGRVGIVGRVE